MTTLSEIRASVEFAFSVVSENDRSIYCYHARDLLGLHDTLAAENARLERLLADADEYTKSREQHITTMATGAEILLAERDRLQGELKEAQRDAQRYRARRHAYVIRRRYNGCAADYDHLNIGFYDAESDRLIADCACGSHDATLSRSEEGR
jgi:hypothetical protein